MSSLPPIDKSLPGVLKNLASRVTLLERRTTKAGSSGGSGGTGAVMPVGTIMPFGGSGVPLGWLLCDGSAVSRVNYAALYGVIGTSYGSGDGSSTFNLPDLKGRVAVGQDAAQTEFDAMGEKGGAKTHTLTIAEMPSHTHPITQPGTIGGSTDKIWGDYDGTAGSQSGATPTARTNVSGFSNELKTTATGGGDAHNNLPPYQVVKYIIATTTTSGGVVDSAQLPPRLGADAMSLGTTDLNTVVESGWYFQNSNTNATTARNYPAPAGRAGELEVTGSTAGTDFVMQRYTDYMNNNVWRRTHYNGTWYDWENDLPDRLATGGQTVTDWNDAINAGFYQGTDAANAPLTGMFTGLVTRVGSRSIQELRAATTTDDVRINTWRRTYSGTWSTWVLIGPFNDATIAHSDLPSAFPLGFSYGQGDANFPTTLGIVEVVRYNNSRAIQRVAEKGDSNRRRWFRTAITDSWGPWVLDGGDSDWVSITATAPWTSTGGLGSRLRGDVVMLRGELMTGTDRTACFTLPSGHRPANRLSVMIARYSTTSAPVYGVLAINTTGECIFSLISGTIPTSSPGLTLGGIQFLTT